MNWIRTTGAFINFGLMSLMIYLLIEASRRENLVESDEDRIALIITVVFILSCFIQMWLYFFHLRKYRRFRAKEDTSGILDMLLEQENAERERTTKELKKFHPLKFWASLFGIIHFGLGSFLWVMLIYNGQLRNLRYYDWESYIPFFIASGILLNGSLSIIYLLKLQQIIK